MKTETDKAIEFLNCRDRHLLYGQPTQYASELNKAIDHIIKVAQQGEKYKQMWNLNMKEAFQNSKEGETIHPTRILLDLEYLEQKYFPKELPDEKTTKL